MCNASLNYINTFETEDFVQRANYFEILIHNRLFSKYSSIFNAALHFNLVKLEQREDY